MPPPLPTTSERIPLGKEPSTAYLHVGSATTSLNSAFPPSLDSNPPAKQHQSQSSPADELRASSCESPSPNRHTTYPYDIPMLELRRLQLCLCSPLRVQPRSTPSVQPWYLPFLFHLINFRFGLTFVTIDFVY
ncbi:hypothetical protein RYX36_037355 [Vicia faba]